MQILKSEQYINEKLDIKPVTKSRLDSVKKLFSKKPKLLLESGDVLVTEYAGDTRRYQIFVAEKDFKEWKVPMPPTEQDCSQGLFLCKNIIYDILVFPVSKYDDNLNLKKSTFTEKAVAIYRNRDIINPPITTTLLLMLVDNIDNLKCVWKADGANINEKLNIQPVTRERLADFRKEPSVSDDVRKFIEECELKWNPSKMSYDCDGDVDVSEDIVTDGKLKIRFGKVEGYFDCSNNELVTLEGAPNEVSGSFYCRNNKLTTLEGAPQKVGGDFLCISNNLTTLNGAPQEVSGSFYCRDNNLTTLEGAPKEVGGYFDCSYNELVTLEGAPNEVGRNFDCTDNKLTTLEGAPQKVGGDFLCISNKLTTLNGAPQEVSGSFYCTDNKLTTLEGAPNEVGGNFECGGNSLTSIEGAPNKVDGDFKCSNNKLTSLEGAPQNVGGDFYCNYNELTTLEGAPQKVGGDFYCRHNPNLVLSEDKPSWIEGKCITVL